MVRRFVELLAVSLASMAGPLIYVPVLARTGTGADFAAFGIGSSVGALAGVLINGGWSLTGEARAAAADSELEQGAQLRSFLGGAARRFAVIGPIAAVVAGALSGTSLAVAGLSAVAVAGSGLSVRWHFVGTSKVASILRWETFPQFTAALCGAGALLTPGAPVRIALLVQPVSGIVLTVMVSRRLARTAKRPMTNPVAPGQKSTWQSSAVGTQLTTAMYGNGLPTLLAAAAGTSQVVPFYVYSRMLNLSTLVVVALSGSFIAWTVRSPSSRKYVVSLIAHVSAGVLSALALLGAGPELSALLFSDEYRMSNSASVALAICIFTVYLNTWTGRIVLVPNRCMKAVLRSTLAGAALGIIGTLALAPSHGYLAAVYCTLAAQLLVFAMQLGPAIQVLRRQRWPRRS